MDGEIRRAKFCQHLEAHSAGHGGGLGGGDEDEVGEIAGPGSGRHGRAEGSAFGTEGGAETGVFDIAAEDPTRLAGNLEGGPHKETGVGGVGPGADGEGGLVGGGKFLDKAGEAIHGVWLAGFAAGGKQGTCEPGRRE